MQGDVIGPLDYTGTQVVKYTYDAWGKPTSKSGTMKNTLGTVQPFGYRGYVYDEETGLYYLQSRYYSPLMCRFISPDYILATAGGIPDKSAYAYCQNNPICAIDADGEWGNWLTGLMTVVAAAVTVVAVVAAAPAAACAATVGLIVAGVSSTTAATLAAVGTAAVATVAISASVDAAVTATTGFSPVRDGLLGGKHDDLYEAFQVARFVKCLWDNYILVLVPWLLVSTTALTSKD